MLNLVLCLPAGLMAVVATRARVGWIVAAVIAPVTVELVQYAAPALGRACQLTDVQDNYQGILIGAVVGGAIALARRVTGADTERGRRPRASR